MTKDYNDLKPGIYLQAGANIVPMKSGIALDPLRPYSITWAELLGTMGSDTAGMVSWSFIAQEERKDQLAEIPYTWTRYNEDFDGQPYGVQTVELAQRVDEAIQLYGQAYVLKQRARTAGIVGLRWLDPSTVEPDYRTADPVEGIRRYKRKQAGREMWLPAEDVIRFMRPGMDEQRPGPGAGQAVKAAAAILRGIEQTTNTFFANNALPITIIQVPEGTPPAEVERVESSFRRLFNRREGTRENRVRGVRADIQIHKLGMTPAELGQDSLTEQKRDEILAAYGVPKSRVLSDAANYATDVAASRRFVQKMGASFQLFAQSLNDDPDIEGDGFALIVDPDSHSAMREDEARRADSVVNYVNAGLTVEAALYLAGIDRNDFPDDMVVIRTAEPADQVDPIQTGRGTPQAGTVSSTEAQAAAEAAEAEKTLAAKAAKEREQFTRWLENRPNADPADFTPNYIDGADMAMLYAKHIASTRRGDAPDAFFWEEGERYP